MYISAEGEANEPNCKDCVRVVEGNIPMVITIPHGGSLKPNNIKNRKNGCYNAIDKKCIYLHQCPDPSNRTIDKYASLSIFHSTNLRALQFSSIFHTSTPDDM